MAAAKINAERRRPLSTADIWAKLSAAQKMALCHIRQYGFELLFIRESQQGLAVARCNDQLLTIDSHGSIDAQPAVQLRHSR